jgi:glyoxylase-like metal-dependent hydrolase (beta-lactamase superfamily II)
MTRITLVFFVAVVAALFAQDAAAQERVWANDQSIEQISEHVYRFGSDNQFGAYVLTDEGIIVIDGHYCGSGTMAWLKSELEKRYDVPVKYTILSHDHPDHSCGTELFNDTSTAIASRYLRPHMLFEQRVSAIPEITFEDEMDLHLGGVYLKLMYLGPTHSDNLIQVHIPDEKVLIAIDSAKGKRLFPDYRDMEVNNQLRVLKILANLPDVDIVLPGHGPITTQQAFLDSRRFIEAMKMSVLELMADGRPLEEIKVRVAAKIMDEFGGEYEPLDTYLESNIVSMYQYLYRYREPNISIKPYDAIACVEDATQCRTSSVKPES